MGAPAAALPCMKPFRTCASMSLTTPGVCGRNTADDLHTQLQAVTRLAIPLWHMHDIVYACMIRALLMCATACKDKITHHLDNENLGKTVACMLETRHVQGSQRGGRGSPRRRAHIPDAVQVLGGQHERQNLHPTTAPISHHCQRLNQCCGNQRNITFYCDCLTRAPTL